MLTCLWEIASQPMHFGSGVTLRFSDDGGVWRLTLSHVRAYPTPQLPGADVPDYNGLSETLLWKASEKGATEHLPFGGGFSMP